MDEGINKTVETSNGGSLEWSVLVVVGVVLLDVGPVVCKAVLNNFQAEVLILQVPDDVVQVSVFTTEVLVFVHNSWIILWALAGESITGSTITAVVTGARGEWTRNAVTVFITISAVGASNAIGASVLEEHLASALSVDVIASVLEFPPPAGELDHLRAGVLNLTLLVEHVNLLNSTARVIDLALHMLLPAFSNDFAGFFVATVDRGLDIGSSGVPDLSDFGLDISLVLVAAVLTFLAHLDECWLLISKRGPSVVEDGGLLGSEESVQGSFTLLRGHVSDVLASNVWECWDSDYWDVSCASDVDIVAMSFFTGNELVQIVSALDSSSIAKDGSNNE